MHFYGNFKIINIDTYPDAYSKESETELYFFQNPDEVSPGSLKQAE